MKRVLSLLAFLLLLVPTYSQAAVTYNFTAYSDFNQGTYAQTKSFTLTVADYITADASYTTADANFVSADYQQIFFLVDAVAHHYTTTPSQALATDYTAYFPVYYFAPASYAANGTYSSMIFGSDQYAVLTVGGSGTPTPVPAAVWLLGSGLFGLAGLRRKIGK